MTDAPTTHREPELPENTSYLLLLAAAPAIWFAHFLTVYIAAAVWCARFAGTDGLLAPLHPVVTGGTLAALAGIASIGVSGYRRHKYGAEALPHDFDSPGDRHRFLGFATLLLAGLSAFATILVAAHFMYFGTCR